MEPVSTWLNAQQWQRILPLIERNPRHGGTSGGDNRLFVEAVLCHIRTGTPWRDLPAQFGAWNSIYIRYKRWNENKIWQRIFQILGDDADFRATYLNDSVLELHRQSARVGSHASSRVLALLEGQLAQQQQQQQQQRQQPAGRAENAAQLAAAL